MSVLQIEFMYRMFQIYFGLILQGEGSFVSNVSESLDYYNILRTKVAYSAFFPDFFPCVYYLPCCTFQVFDFLLNGDLYPYKPYFYNVTHTNNYYNFLLTEVNT